MIIKHTVIGMIIMLKRNNLNTVQLYMKIAILFSGNLRKFTFNENGNLSNSELWKKIIEKYKCDVFAYADTNDFYYNNTQYFTDKNKNVTNANHNRYFANNIVIENSDARNIISNIFHDCFGDNVKKYQIDDYNDINQVILNDNIYHKKYMQYNTSRNYNFKAGLINQAYKIKKCFELLESYENENNFKYDIIIKTRFCGVFTNIIDKINLFDIQYNDNTLICDYSKYFCYDWWAIGTRCVMEQYCNYYNFMSPNLIDDVKLFIYTDSNCQIIDSSNEFNADKHQSNNIKIDDVSDSYEFGLSYLHRNMKFNNCGLKYNLNKFYN